MLEKEGRRALGFVQLVAVVARMAGRRRERKTRRPTLNECRFGRNIVEKSSVRAGREVAPIDHLREKTTNVRSADQRCASGETIMAWSAVRLRFVA